MIEESFKFCRGLARREARNFYFSFLTLPRAKRNAMCAIYAWMRYVDDLADEAGSPGEARKALEQWRVQTRAILQGSTDSNFHFKKVSLWPAFADTVKRYEISLHYLDEIIEGALMDQEIIRYTTFDELYRYCYRVASVVGLVCLRVFGYTDSQAEQKGEWLGIAFQLTNILRDVREDAGRGRIYLPQEDLRHYGVSEKDILEGYWSESLHQLLKLFAKRTEDYYIRAQPIADLVSKEARPTLRIMTEIYHGILMEIERMDYHIWDHRAHLPTWKKIMIVIKNQIRL